MPSKPSALPAPEIVEIGSEEIGDGMVLKTIVISEVRDGVRTQKTTTVTVPRHHRKA